MGDINICLDWDDTIGSYRGQHEVELASNNTLTFDLYVDVERETYVSFYDGYNEYSWKEEIYIDDIRLWDLDGNPLEVNEDDMKNLIRKSLIIE